MSNSPIEVVSEQGWREDMEDAHCVYNGFAGNQEWIFGGVFDGHGSHVVAYRLAEYMAGFVHEQIISGKKPRTAHKNAYNKAAKEPWAQTIYEGSCAATFLIQGRNITCANVGDCRVVVLGKSARQLTCDHNASNWLEAKRVNGNIIKVSGHAYIAHEDRSLAVTRAIGDLGFYEAGLIATPYTSEYRLKPTDRFVVAASDGLFTKTANRRVLELSRTASTARDLAIALKDEVEARKGSDNLTIIVVQLNST